MDSGIRKLAGGFPLSSLPVLFAFFLSDFCHSSMQGSRYRGYFAEMVQIAPGEILVNDSSLSNLVHLLLTNRPDHFRRRAQNQASPRNLGTEWNKAPCAYETFGANSDIVRNDTSHTHENI